MFLNEEDFLLTLTPNKMIGYVIQKIGLVRMKRQDFLKSFSNLQKIISDNNNPGADMIERVAIPKSRSLEKHSYLYL